MNKDRAPSAQTATTKAAPLCEGRMLRRGVFWLGLFCPLVALSGSNSLSVGDASVTITGAASADMTFAVTRSADRSYDAYLPYNTVDDTAIAGTDYTARSGVLKLPADADNANLTIGIFGSATSKSNRRFKLKFGNAVGTGPTPQFADADTTATGQNPQAVVVADFNLDGKPDMAVANFTDNTASVLLNKAAIGNTDPSFASATLATGLQPYAIASGDFNHDGKPDLAVVNSGSNTVSVFLNKTNPGAASPTFSGESTFATGSHPLAIAAADLNGDGKDDLLVADTDDNTASALINTAAVSALSPSFAARQPFNTGIGGTGGGPISIGSADFDGDGRLDLMTANFTDNSITVRVNKTTVGSTTASFDNPLNYSAGISQPRSIAAADINGDGRPDLLIANAGSASAQVFMNAALPVGNSPGFAFKSETYPVGATPFSIRAADINGDGRPDLITTNQGADTVSVLVNVTPSKASFASFVPHQDFASGAGPRGLATADFNGDGKPDLATTNATANNIAVLLNSMPDSAAPVALDEIPLSADTNHSPNWIDAADLNGDGRPELVIATTGTTSVSVVRVGLPTPGAASGSYGFNGTPIQVGGQPHAVKAADLNGDGKPDLIATLTDVAKIAILINTTPDGAIDPTFGAALQYQNGVDVLAAVRIADINGDGKPDLLAANVSSNTVTIALNTTPPGASNAQFAARQTFSTGAANLDDIEVADINSDGRPDLLTNDGTSNTIGVWLNITTPGANTVQFAPKTTLSTGLSLHSLVAADINGDSRPDLLAVESVGFPASDFVAFINTTSPGDTVASFGPHQSFPSQAIPSRIATGDFNGDGKPDVLVASADSQSLVLHLNQTAPGATSASFGAATPPLTVAGSQLVVGDLDLDGLPDVAVVNALTDSLRVLLNHQYRTLAPPANAIGTIHYDIPAIRISVSPNSLDFGDVLVGQGSAFKAVTVSNTGSEVVHIGGFQSVGPVGPSSPPPTGCVGRTLSVGASCLVNVYVEPSAPGAGTATLEIISDVGSSLAAVTAQYNGISRTRTLSTAPGSLTFGNQPVGTQSSTQNVVVTNTGNVALAVLGSSGSGPDALDFPLISNDCGTIAPAATCTLTFAFKPTTSGTRSAVESILARDADDATQISFDFPVSGTGIQAVGAWAPASYDFGEIAVGDSSLDHVFTLTNSGNTALTITGGSVSPEFPNTATSDCGVVVAAGASCSVPLHFVPAQAGPRTGTVTFHTNVGDITATLSGTGVAAQAIAELTPASFDFGAIAVGSSSLDHAFTLTNTGNASLTVTGAQTPAEFPGSSNNCPTVLPAGASCVFNVQFVPAADGTRTAALTVYTSAGNQVAALSGTGGLAATSASLTPVSDDFGTVTVGNSSALHSFTLTNSGSASLTVMNAAVSSNFTILGNTCSTPLAAGASCTVGVYFIPTTAGPLNGTLSVSTSIGNQVATLSGTGAAAQATASLAPASYDFGAVAAGSSSSLHDFTLTNTGNTPLDVIDAVVSNNFLTLANTCSTPLAAGASCAVSVYFTPTTAGTLNGTLTVSTSIGDQVAILSGTGTSGDSTPTPISFAPLNDVARSTAVISDSVTVGGVDTAIAVTVSGGTYAVNGGSYTDAAGSVHVGDAITVRQTSASSFSTTTTATLTIGSGGDAQSADFVVTTLSADTTPDAFGFGSREGVAPGSTQTSNTITPGGFDDSAAISVVGGRYAINGGAFTSGSGSINPGDSVAVQLTASDQFASTASVKLTIGGVTGSFTVTTIAADTTPDTFTFGAASGVMPGSLQTSNTVTISGLNTSAPIAINGGSYRINSGAYTSAAGSIGNGDTVSVRQTASAAFATTTTATLTIGAVSAPYAVTTVAAMSDPDAFTFGTVSDVAPGSVQTSGAITVSGTNTASPISVSGGSYAINGGAYTSTAGTVRPGNSVAVRTTASAAFSSAKTVTLTIGAMQGTYTVTTLAADITPDTFTFGSVGGVLPDSAQTSETIVVSGINSASPISITGGEYRINDGAYTAEDGTVVSGDRVSLQKLAPSGFGETAQATLMIGGVSGSFSVTTTTVDTQPDTFTIPVIADAEPDSVVSSEVVLIGGINAPATFTISNGCLQVSDGSPCITSGALQPGDSFQIVVRSSADYCQSVSGKATIGGVSSTFTVKTRCDLPEVHVKAGGGSLGGDLLLMLGGLAALRRWRLRFRRSARVAIVGLLLAGSIGRAQALDTDQIYGGIRLGRIDNNLAGTLRRGLREQGYTGITSSGDSDRLGGTLYIGYAFLPFGDFELGYTHADNPDVRLHGTLASGTSLDALLHDAGRLARGYGDQYSAAIRVPMPMTSRLSIAPRFGLLLTTTSVRLRAADRQLTFNDHGGGYTAGADLRYRLWRGLQLGVSINYFDASSDKHSVEYAGLIEWRR